jgi:hypothetical protein
VADGDVEGSLQLREEKPRVRSGKLSMGIVHRRGAKVAVVASNPARATAPRSSAVDRRSRGAKPDSAAGSSDSGERKRRGGAQMTLFYATGREKE